MKLLLKNGHIIEPASGRDEVADILIVDGMIEKIGTKLGAAAGVQVHNLDGKIVAPGFIDMHVHTREPGFEHKETIATAVSAAASGGFTAICCMPNTDPAIDDASVVEYIKKRAASLSYVGANLVDVYPIAAVTKGREGKELAPMAELAEAGAVAFSDDGAAVANAEVMRRALEYASMLGKPIIQHAEEHAMTKCGAMNEGLVATELGLPPIPSVAEEIVVGRDVQLVEYLGAGSDDRDFPQYHVAHISTRGAVELVRRAKRKNLPVTCEATPHHFSLTDEAVRSFDTNTKMNPPLRTRDDVEAVKEGLDDDTIDVIATDHAPHSFDEKQVEYVFAPFGIIGLESALGLAIKELVDTKILTIAKLIEKFSVNPRRILHLPIIKIVEGEKANLTIFDPTMEWTVDVKQFKSKSKNSPFDGWKLKGKAFAIVNKGGFFRA